MSEKDTIEQGTATGETAADQAKASHAAAARVGMNLGEGSTGSTGAITDSRDEQIAQLKAELQRERVEHGRVKALSQSDSEKSRRIKELEDENAQLRNEKIDYMQLIPEDLRASVDPDSAKAFGALAKGLVDRKDAEYNKRDEERRAQELRLLEEQKQSRLERINQQIEWKFPGFFANTGVGGSMEKPWLKFLDRGHRDSVVNAYNDGNFVVLSDLISLFLSEAGVTQRNDATGAITSPRNTTLAGYDGAAAGSDKRYSFDEYAEALEKAGNDARSGVITGAQYRAIMQELSKARDEGRVAARPA